MKNRKLNYRFHNPNTATTAAENLLKVFIESNKGKVEKALQRAAEEHPDEQKSDYEESEQDKLA